MRHYKLTVSYDGTQYYGWQKQPNRITVEQILHDSFVTVFRTDCVLSGASRTDAGVHALGQVVLLKTELELDAAKMKFAWNNSLPADIHISSLKAVDATFNPYRLVQQKTYWYHFFIDRPLPFCAGHGWYVRKPVSIEKLEQVLQIFVGTHDFRSFSTGNERENTVRTIDSIEVKRLKQKNTYRIVVKAPRFLRYMIRRIVGAAIAASCSDRFSVDHVREVLEKKNPE
ncbi:MAG TPA: tRNA pseudouridine(38-40) synthase TruA, partial [Candidatus Babeliales bacterium]|nr:tRNA pseudouridine(38-40) synthase TruA [Candidatus Babeliales bacterium]